MPRNNPVDVMYGIKLMERLQPDLVLSVTAMHTKGGPDRVNSICFSMLLDKPYFHGSVFSYSMTNALWNASVLLESKSGPYLTGADFSSLGVAVANQLFADGVILPRKNKHLVPEKSMIADETEIREYYISKDGVQYGSFDRKTLYNSLSDGRLSRDDLAWTSGESTWKSVEYILSRY